VAEQFTGTPGIRKGGRYGEGLQSIVEGKYDDIPEQAFYMRGTIEEVLEAGEDEGGSVSAALDFSRQPISWFVTVAAVALN